MKRHLAQSISLALKFLNEKTSDFQYIICDLSRLAFFVVCFHLTSSND